MVAPCPRMILRSHTSPPACRESRAPFAFIINLVVPGTPMLSVVATYFADQHPNAMGSPPEDPMGEEHDWHGFDFVLHKCVDGGCPGAR